MGDFYKYIEHERLSKWGKDFVFMEMEGKAVGRVYIYDDEKEVAYIEGLHVSEKERLKGLGGNLLNILIDKCKKLGAKRCVLWCYKESWTYEWYQKIGFKYLDEYKDDMDAVWMFMDLINN